MKPTFQASRAGRVSEPCATGFNNIRTLATDWSFQSSAPVFRGNSGGFRISPEGSASTPGLWTLSQRFIEAEGKREYRFEAVLFGVLVALAAWPIAQALHAVAELLK